MERFRFYGGSIWFDGSMCRDEEGRVGKGIFPYLANSEKFDERIGCAPIDFCGPIEHLPLDYWDLDDMKVGERDRCMKWLEERKGYVYNVREQLAAYCKMDTLILKFLAGFTTGVAWKKVKQYRPSMCAPCTRP